MPDEQKNSFYEESCLKDAQVLEGGACSSYYYHPEFPNLQFYANVPGALEAIQSIVNLMTVNPPNNPLAKKVRKALTMHGKIQVKYIQHSNFSARWLSKKKIIEISNKDCFEKDSVIDSFIFEICNATNKEQWSLESDTEESSLKYALKMEIIEMHTNNKTLALLENLGVPTNRIIEDEKQAVESAKAQIESDGFSHFDHYIRHHNDHKILRMQIRWSIFSIMQSFLYCFANTSRKTQDACDQLNHERQALSVLLQERYAIRHDLNQKAKGNLIEPAGKKNEYELELCARLQAIRIQNQKIQQQLEEAQAQRALRKRMLNPTAVKENNTHSMRRKRSPS